MCISDENKQPEWGSHFVERAILRLFDTSWFRFTSKLYILAAFEHVPSSIQNGETLRH